MTFNYLLEFHLSDLVQLKYYIEGQIRFEIFAAKFLVFQKPFPRSALRVHWWPAIFAVGNLGKL